MGTNWSESEEDSKESDVSFKTDWSRRYKIWSSIGVRVESLQSAISCASAERDDSQGCTAHVKETPPSPKEKMALRRSQSDPVTRDFDIPLRQKNPLRMAATSMESLARRSSRKSRVTEKMRSVKRMLQGSTKTFDSGVSDFNNGSRPKVRPKKSLFAGIGRGGCRKKKSQGCTAHVKETPPSPKEKPEDLIGADIDSVRDDEDWAKSSYSLMAKGSMESIDSGVSFKSDQSKDGLIDLKDRVSPSLFSPPPPLHHLNQDSGHLPSNVQPKVPLHEASFLFTTITSV